MMIISGNNDISKEINVKLSQNSLNKSSEDKPKVKAFDETFNKKMNDIKDEKSVGVEPKISELRKSRIESKYDNKSKYDDKVPNEREDDDKYSRVENDDKYSRVGDDDKVSKNDDDDKLPKLKDDLDKASKDLKEAEDSDNSDDSDKKVKKVIEDLISIMNGMMNTKSLNGEDGQLNLKNLTSDDVSTKVDITKTSDVNSNLKDMVKLLSDMSDGTKEVDMDSIKDMIKNLKIATNEATNPKKELTPEDLKANIIKDMKIALGKNGNDSNKLNEDLKEDNGMMKVNTATNMEASSGSKSSDKGNTFKDTDSNNKNLMSSNDKTIKKEESFLDSLINESDKTNANKFVPAIAPKVGFDNVNATKTSESVPVVDRANLTEGIVKNIKFMQTNNLKELTVSLNPKDLGSMLIKISVEDGKLSAKILAEKKETFELINANTADVKNALGNVDNKVQQVSVDIQFGDATAYEQFKEGQGFNENQRGQNRGSSDGVAENNINDDIEDEHIYEDGVVNMLA